MNRGSSVPSVVIAVLGLALVETARPAGSAAQGVRITGAPCDIPPALRCVDGQCPGTVVTNGGSVVDPKTGPTYFLDYPCDLKPDEQIRFVLTQNVVTSVIEGFGRVVRLF